MTAQIAAVIVSVVILISALCVKFRSRIALLEKYPNGDYHSPAAQRLYLFDKVTPIIACAAIVTLSYCTGLWWIELPAWLLLACISIGVLYMVRKRNGA